jgi:glycosyltransferase involved in cell wall biosynthesis
MVTKTSDKYSSLVSIPTQDPQAALAFCKRLDDLIKASSLGTAQGTLSSQERKPAISVVIPVFNERDNLPILCQRITAVMESCEPNYEIVFVNDGSRDGSVEFLQSMKILERKITIIDLARNFGHQVAISAGMDFARGDAVIIMDADLQDPPEVIPKFIAKWREGHDVVYAVRENRKEGLLKRLIYASFYRFLQKIANIKIPLDAGDFCIMDRRVVDLLVQMPERNRFVRGIRSWIGLDQVGLAYDRQARYAGKTKYTFSRLLYLALDGLVSFSYIPLRMITILGLVVSLISFLLAIFYLLQKLFSGLNPPGFATTIVAIFFLAGMQLTTLGVIGEYVGRIFEEVKRRPLYVVRKVLGGANAHPDAEQ